MTKRTLKLTQHIGDFQWLTDPVRAGQVTTFEIATSDNEKGKDNATAY